MNERNDTGLLIRALEFAAGKHRMQRRKIEDASPYIDHPIALMNVLCIEAGVRDATILSAAALHDTIEDTETTGQELESEFGSENRSRVGAGPDHRLLSRVSAHAIQQSQAAIARLCAALAGAALQSRAG